ncbi:BQ5605_C014g07526 [Microbotryum silenes-dioicae]|uniref:BQ5605_C014g07526 protein n=1 Tax=Microbotryum silenes-dioicae TaxID=796604 RepID=A0A2X0NRH8_9BASI|nr:BQ5605_C014g07526 [Microbotryum silenes-dioicae]
MASSVIAGTVYGAGNFNTDPVVTFAVGGTGHFEAVGDFCSALRSACIVINESNGSHHGTSCRQLNPGVNGTAQFIASCTGRKKYSNGTINPHGNLGVFTFKALQALPVTIFGN